MFAIVLAERSARFALTERNCGRRAQRIKASDEEERTSIQVPRKDRTVERGFARTDRSGRQRRCRRADEARIYRWVLMREAERCWIPARGAARWPGCSLCG